MHWKCCVADNKNKNAFYLYSCLSSLSRSLYKIKHKNQTMQYIINHNRGCVMSSDQGGYTSVKRHVWWRDLSVVARLRKKVPDSTVHSFNRRLSKTGSSSNVHPVRDAKMWWEFLKLTNQRDVFLSLFNLLQKRHTTWRAMSPQPSATTQTEERAFIQFNK